MIIGSQCASLIINSLQVMARKQGQPQHVSESSGFLLLSHALSKLVHATLFINSRLPPTPPSTPPPLQYLPPRTPPYACISSATKEAACCKLASKNPDVTLAPFATLGWGDGNQAED
jgi:hypothetical protein